MQGCVHGRKDSVNRGIRTMLVSHNLQAMNANRQLNIVTDKRAKSTEKLSSGYRINRAADDAAGLAISEKMRRQIRGLTQATYNVEEGIGYVQTADGALAEVHDILHRITELSVKASNGTLEDTDREYADSEVQHLKDELDRVFDTTSFNKRLIWDKDTNEKKQIGSEKVTAVTMKSLSKNFDISNQNVDILPKSSISILADATQGVALTYTANNGTTYTSNRISLSDLKDKNYSASISEFFRGTADLFDSSTTPPTPLFDGTVAFTPARYTSDVDIAKGLNGGYISNSESVGLSVQFEDASGNKVSSPLGISTSLYFSSAYKAYANGAGDPNRFSFDNGVDDVLTPSFGSNPNSNFSMVPNYTTVADARTDSIGYKLEFDMVGLGPVSANMTGVSYSISNQNDTNAEGTWWQWITRSDGSKYKSNISRTIPGNSLATVMSVLTGGYGDSTPGVLSPAEGGCNTSGSSTSLSMNFDLKSGGSTIGSMTISVPVSSSDTEQTVLNKLSQSLNSNTIIDLYTTSSNVNGNSFRLGGLYGSGYKFDSPLFQATNRLIIQAGADAGQIIEITYDSMSVLSLGLQGTNVMTVANAQKAIVDVEKAMEIVSAQRADFGAYQNRLEHAAKNLRNVTENTQAAESRIRDTDMAAEMVKFSLNNILAQAGQAMLAQANQSNSGVLALLQG